MKVNLSMKRIKYLPIYVILITLAMVAFIAFLAHFAPVTVLNPSGTVAKDERNLMLWVVGLMSVLAIPSLFMTYYVAWKYRADNPKHPSFKPEHTASKKMSIVWWGIPTIAALILSCIIWPAAHKLDPYKPLASSVKPVKVQVIALQWKWLFIYPEQHIATLNVLEIPAQTPIDFELTADAPMTSFWIPELGGQIYAMNGMQTQTHFISEKTGTFEGRDAEINGDGYADMSFAVKATTPAEFTAWVAKMKKGNTNLNQNVYNELAKASEDRRQLYYSSVDSNLFMNVLMKDMVPPSEPTHKDANGNTMKGMDMQHMDNMDMSNMQMGK